MKRFISFGSIEQFRSIVKEMSELDNSPTTVLGTITEKIHGTNASVCWNAEDGLWVQSRNTIITPEADNAGCAAWVMKNEDAWMGIIRRLLAGGGTNVTVSIYFEWCGGNIFSNSAVSGLDKRAIIFPHYRITDDKTDDSEWVKLPEFWAEHYPESNIFFGHLIHQRLVYLDFETPATTNNKLLELVDEYENKSPTAQFFNLPDNIGEGYVVTFWWNDRLYRFKVKGEKHSATKVKTLKPVDEVLENKKREFANYAANADRLEQAWQTVFGIDNELNAPDIKLMGDFLRAVNKDVMKEESDIMEEQELDPKMVNSNISKIARLWFMEQLDGEWLK